MSWQLNIGLRMHPCVEPSFAGDNIDNTLTIVVSPSNPSPILTPLTDWFKYLVRFTILTSFFINNNENAF